MNKLGGFARYGTGRTFAIVLLILGVFLSDPASAQDCNAAKQRIYHITDTEAQQVPDSLQTILDLASLVRDCEDEVSLDLERWLLINEVFALDGLGRYAEAAEVVDHFFEVYFDEASDYYRGRFYLWRLHLHALSGNGTGMVTDYAEAQRYAHTLDPINRAHLYANGAYAYLKINENQAAQHLTGEALQLIEPPETYDERMAAARALLLGAEAQLRLNLPSPRIERELLTASRLYRELGDSAQVALARTLLGMTYAAAGDTSRAFTELKTGVQLAQASGSIRSEITALYRQGQVLRQWGKLDTAQASLLQALEAVRPVHEFYLDIAYELAQLHDERHEYRRAMYFYQAVVEAPKSSGLTSILEAERKAQHAEVRLLLLASEQKQRHLHLILAGLLLLVTLFSSGIVFLWHRPRRLAVALEAKGNGVFIPQRLATGRTLDDLVVYFQEALEAKLFGLRLACLFAVLFEPDLVLDSLEDARLIKQVEVGRLANNTALFQCAAAVEQSVTGRSLGEDVSNTLGAHLRDQFKQQGWPWPTHPTEWKQYFMEHHVEYLI